MNEATLHAALGSVKLPMPFRIDWNEKGELDGHIEIKVTDDWLAFDLEIKQEVRPGSIPNIIKLRERHPQLMLVANRIASSVKEWLREESIAYLESNGNLFLQRGSHYIYVETNQKNPRVQKTSNRAFTKTGIKVLFHLLDEPALMNATQREISERAGVGLGNIPQVIQGLKETGYLLSLKRGAYVWDRREELIERWISGYETELRPRLVQGTYNVPDLWRDLSFDPDLSVWGGEPAAELLTQHLRAERFVMFTKESRLELMKKYRIIPAEHGALEVLSKFWEENEQRITSPPLLVYAELVIAGGKRNLETAKLIYDEYLTAKL